MWSKIVSRPCLVVGCWLRHLCHYPQGLSSKLAQTRSCDSLRVPKKQAERLWGLLRPRLGTPTMAFLLQFYWRESQGQIRINEEIEPISWWKEPLCHIPKGMGGHIEIRGISGHFFAVYQRLAYGYKIFTFSHNLSLSQSQDLQNCHPN